MDLTSALHFLKLKDVPQVWVDTVWDVEFAENVPMDHPIEEELSASGDEAFRNLYQCLLAHADEKPLSSSRDDLSQNIWSMLAANQVSTRSLVAILSYFVAAGKAKSAGAEQRLSCLHAAATYLLLLGIPGSIANRVYHEIFLESCLRVALHCWPQDSGKKRKKDNSKAHRGEAKRPKPPHRKENQEMEEDEEREEEEIYFSSEELMNIRDAVVLLVRTVLRLLQAFSLKDKEHSAKTCTQVFIKLLYFEPVFGQLSFAAPLDAAQLKSIPEMVFHGLQLLCSPKHGDVKKSLCRVFHQLLYLILMMSKGDRGKPTLLVPNQAVLATRDQGIHFICHMVEEHQDLALPYLQILLQHIGMRMVEKAEFRTHGAQAVGMLTSQMASPDYARFIQWLYNFSRHSKMVSRLFSLDVVMVLLKQQDRRPEECRDPELAHFLPHQFLIQEVLFARRFDTSPTVQGHALKCLAQCLELPSLNATQAVHQLFNATGVQTVLENTEGLTVSSQQTQKTYRSLPFKTVEITSTLSNQGCDAKENLALLLRRVEDFKTNVRKSALQALTGLLKHNVIPMNLETLLALAHRSRDPSISVKKKALQCMGELLAVKPEHGALQKAWLYCVLPAVMDCENSVQEKALEALEMVILGNMKAFSPDRHLDAQQRLTWDLLVLLCEECSDLSRYFTRATSVWSKQNKLTKTFIGELIVHTDAPHSAGAWLLLSKVAAFTDRIPQEYVLQAWDNMVRGKSVSGSTCCHILSVVGDVAANMRTEDKGRLVDEMISWLKTFALSLEVINAAVQAVYQLCKSEDIKQTQNLLNHHCGELVSACETYLASIVLSQNGIQNFDEELMVKHLHTLGVASLHCPAKVTKRVILLVESIFTSHSDQLPDRQPEPPTVTPSSQLNSLPAKIRAHGVLTLGKLCLQHADLAQKFLPVFARELEVGTDMAVRNNVVVTLCDLCVRYTNMVDHYIPNIAACLRDSDTEVRQQTLISLTRLLQEEYVKWKGSLFFRFVVVLADPVPAIASLCEYCLLHHLLKKNPEMFSQHFIECIFHFNSYDKHKSYNKFPQTQREKLRFSLKGAENREKRFRIYSFLLENFTDAQRFNIANRINQNILACFADEELPLDEDGAEILAETFSILTMKEIRVQNICPPAGGAAGEEEEEENMARAVMQAAQRKVVSQVQKKILTDHTVPLIISLKNLMEQKRSPVLKDLMFFLKVTLQDYHSDLKEIFSGDEQLAAEVEYLLKKAEEEKKMEQLNLSGKVQTEALQDSVRVPSGPAVCLSLTPRPPRARTLAGRQIQTERTERVRRMVEHLSLPRSPNLQSTVISKGAVTNRAISTPKDTTINLTFNMGVSVICSDREPNACEESSVLHICSPEELDAGQRQWNVESPMRQKKRR